MCSLSQLLAWYKPTWETFSRVTLYGTLLVYWYWFFLSLIHALLNACLQLPHTARRKCSIPSKHCSYHQLCVKYKIKCGFVFVSLPVCTIELRLAFCGNQVVSCFAGSREGCSLSLCNLPCWSISLSCACQFHRRLLGNQNLRVSDAGADVV